MLEMLDGLVDPAEVVEQSAQVVVRFGIAGIDRESCFKLTHGVLLLAQPLQGIAVVIAGLGAPEVVRCRQLVEGDRLRITPPLSEQVG